MMMMMQIHAYSNQFQLILKQIDSSSWLLFFFFFVCAVEIVDFPPFRLLLCSLLAGRQVVVDLDDGRHDYW
ncbi:hypothetical protein D3C80_2143160 [compost metagenome]